MVRSHPLRIALIGGGLCALLAGSSHSATLAQLKDRRRVVVAFAADPSDPRLAAQRQAMAPLLGGPDDRDLTLAVVAGERVEGLDERAGELRRRFGVGPAAFAVLLIGKDGTVAVRSARPIAAARLAATIDAMPMRQTEMRRAGQAARRP